MKINANRPPASGKSLVYAPTLGVWISDNFMAADVDLTTLIVSILRGADPPWTLIASAGDFEDAKRHANRMKRNASVIALCTPAECAVIESGMPPALSRHVFDMDKFLKFVVQLDAKLTHLGV